LVNQLESIWSSDVGIGDDLQALVEEIYPTLGVNTKSPALWDRRLITQGALSAGISAWNSVPTRRIK
jgi:hypothetical protein